jgi:hypothetical protein
MKRSNGSQPPSRAIAARKSRVRGADTLAVSLDCIEAL